MYIFAKIGKKIEKILMYYINYKIIKNYNQTFFIFSTMLNISKFFCLKNNTYRKIEILKRLIFREVTVLKKNYLKKIITSKKLFYNQEKERKKKNFFIKFEKQNTIHYVLRKMIFLIQKERKKERKIKSNLKYSKITIENFKKIQKKIYEKTHGITNFSQNMIEKIENIYKKIKILFFFFNGILIYKFLNFITSKD